MHELLANLPPDALVLDLGCGGGSFDSDAASFTVIRIDLDGERLHGPHAAQADAAHLPFTAHCFDSIISNHSLEHFDDLSDTLEEIGRVLKPTGSLYVGVPDASTISDRLYRWLGRGLGRGGGHVNPFTSANHLAAAIERAVGVKHIATRTLCSSFAYLNRKNQRGRIAKRLWLVGGGTQVSLLLINFVSNLCDRFLATRMRVYGWALYFGQVEAPIERRTWTNVCIRCGSGYSSDWLLHERKLVQRFLAILFYRCPQCGTANLFTVDTHYKYSSE